MVILAIIAILLVVAYLFSWALGKAAGRDNYFHL
jgi:hypothetical protein